MRHKATGAKDTRNPLEFLPVESASKIITEAEIDPKVKDIFLALLRRIG